MGLSRVGPAASGRPLTLPRRVAAIVILEGLVTTLDPAGTLNVAPMGPRIADDGSFARFVLRPYRTSTTCRNLLATGQGVLHVTDDVRLIARTAIGLDPMAPWRPAEHVQGAVLTGACRYFEFRVTAVDDRDDRVTLQAETVHEGRLRDFFGLNRAKHAVVEAAILATRIQFLPADAIRAQVQALAVLVEKTGGPDEHAAFALLRDHIAAGTAVAAVPAAGTILPPGADQP